MARTFGDPYDIEVPINTTWTEGVQFLDANGAPVPLPPKARGQLREVLDYDDAGNKVYGPSVLDLSTEDGTLIIEPTVNSVVQTGVMNIQVSADVVDGLSPSNTRLQVDYDIEFYDDSVSPTEREPALAGTVTFTQRVTQE